MTFDISSLESRKHTLLMEEWRSIESFPEYSVSNAGRVRNEETGRLLVLTRNQQGIVYVGLSRLSIQYQRSVARLVATAFIKQPNSSFDTPINLDGNRANNEVPNIMWRPRWFAVKYVQQFSNGERGFEVPVVEIKSGEWFPTSWHAAIEYGLIDREILIATMNRTYVWPTYQVFEVYSQNTY